MPQLQPFAEFDEARPSRRQQVVGALRSAFGVSLRDISVVNWAPKLNRQQLVGDVLAALVVAIMLIPQSMAYANLAGLSPIYGLYASTIPSIVFSLFTTSSQLAVGPNAPTAILMAGIVSAATDAAPKSPDFTRLHFTLAFTAGAIQLVLAAFRFGIVARLLSWPVISGFSTGAALIIAISQFPDALGVKVPRETGFFMRAYRVAAVLPNAKWQPALLTIIGVIILLFWKDVKIRGRGLPARTPMPLVLLAVAIVVSWAGDLAHTADVATVGPVPSSLPTLSMPFQSIGEVTGMASSALVLALLNYVQSVSVAVVFGKKKGEAVSPNKELFALGAASVAGSFFSCHTPSGAFTRTAVQAGAGAQTPLTSTLTGLIVLVFIVTLAPVCQYIPNAMLAAIVLPATKSLIAVDDAKMLWHSSLKDFLHFAVTCLAVLALDIQNGLLVGVSLSLLNLLLQSFQPRIVELGRLPHTSVFVALARFPNAVRLPGMALLRIDSELHFGNIETLVNKLMALAVPRTAPPATASSPSPAAEVAAGALTAIALSPPHVAASVAGAKGDGAAGAGGIDDALAAAAVADAEEDVAVQAAATAPAAAPTGIDAVAAGGSTARASSNGLGTIFSRPTIASGRSGGAFRPPEQLARRRVYAIAHDPEGAASARSHHDGSGDSDHEGDTVALAGVQPPSPGITAPTGPLKAVIVDASRVVRLDTTAARELYTTMMAFAPPPIAPENAAAGTAVAVAQAAAALPASTGKPYLIFAGMPGPARDALDAFGAARKRAKLPAPPVVHFMTVAAAVAFVEGGGSLPASAADVHASIHGGDAAVAQPSPRTTTVTTVAAVATSDGVELTAVSARSTPDSVTDAHVDGVVQSAVVDRVTI